MAAISPKEGPVAVTGASGLMGGHMVRELVLYGYRVRACIRDATSWRGQSSIEYLNRLLNVEVIGGCDLFTPGSYDTVFKGCSAVFHTAAVVGSSADGNSQPLGGGDTSQDVYNGGMAGTQNVVDAINSSGSVRRLLYTSSIAAVSPIRGTPGNVPLPSAYEWTETDWASEHVDPEVWQAPWNAYSRSKVDTEHLVNAAADQSDGRWDVISVNPGSICGPVLFKAQSGMYVEQIGRMVAGLEPNWPSAYDRFYTIIDVRDLVKALRLAAESAIDHRTTHGGSRYIMQGTSGVSDIPLSTVVEIIRQQFPEFVLGAPASVDASGEPIRLPSGYLNNSKKAMSVLGATIRPVEETIRDVVESLIELDIIAPQLR